MDVACQESRLRRRLLSAVVECGPLNGGVVWCAEQLRTTALQCRWGQAWFSVFAADHENTKVEMSLSSASSQLNSLKWDARCDAVGRTNLAPGPKRSFDKDAQ